MSRIIVGIIILYTALVLGIGFVAAKKIRNISDYVVAGHRLNPLLLAGTLAATALGGGTVMGVTASACSGWGISAFWYIAAMSIALFFLGFLAPRFRSVGVRTMPEYFRMRYGRLPGLICSGIMIVTLIGMTSAELKAAASLIEAMLGMDYNTALLLVSIVIIVYSALGGLWGVAMTDLFQFLVAFFSMLLVLPFVISMAGGWEQVRASVAPELLDPIAGIGGEKEILGLILLFFTTFSVGQETVSRFSGAKDNRTARLGTWIASAAVLLFSAMPVLMGLSILTMYNNGMLQSGAMNALESSGRYALPVLAATGVPPVLTGFLLAGVLSASMSSADSTLFGIGSVYSIDIYREFICPEADGRKQVAIARVSMVFASLISFSAAIYAGDILQTMTFALALRAVGIFIPYVLGHFVLFGSQAGALASMAAGIGVFLWASQETLEISLGLEMILTLGISTVVYMIFSKAVPDKRKTDKSE